VLAIAKKEVPADEAGLPQQVKALLDKAVARLR